MKRLPIYLILLFQQLNFNLDLKEVYKSYLDFDFRHIGKVKSIDVYQSKTKTLSLKPRTSARYDLAGNVIEVIITDKIIEKCEYIKNKRTKEQRFNIEQTLVPRDETTYTYNDKLQLIEKTYNNYSSTTSIKLSYTNDKLSKESEYFKDQLNITRIFQYTDTSEVIQEFNKSGKLLTSRMITYNYREHKVLQQYKTYNGTESFVSTVTFDKNGNEVKHVFNNKVERTDYLQFDSHKNWIRKAIYSEKDTLTITRIIKYY